MDDDPGLTASTDFTKYGLTGIASTTTHTAWGRTKNVAGLFVKEWLFLALSIVNIFAAIGLTIARLVIVVESSPQSADFTFTLLLLINAVFSLYYVVHGVLKECKFELYAFIAAILVVLIYCIVEYAFFNVKGRTTLKLVRLVLACILAPPNIYLAWSVARDFGWLEFKIVGASQALQAVYRQSSLFSCLLKFDLQVTTSFVILALDDGADLNVPETVTLGVGIPFSFLLDVLGWITLRKEKKLLAIAFLLIGIAKPVYYIFKLVKIYVDMSNDKTYADTIIYSLLCADSVHFHWLKMVVYSVLVESITSVVESNGYIGSLAFLVWVILMFELRLVYQNFGKGLRERIFESGSTETTGLLSRLSRRSSNSLN